MTAKREKRATSKAGAKANSSAGGILRRPFLISVGVLALAEEQFSTVVDSLMKRGEEAQTAGQKYIKRFMEDRQDQRKAQKSQFEKKMESRDDWILRTLHWLNIPTRDDIAELNKKVDALIKRVA